MNMCFCFFSVNKSIFQNINTLSVSLSPWFSLTPKQASLNGRPTTLEIFQKFLNNVDLIFNSFQGHSTILCLKKEAVGLWVKQILCNQLIWDLFSFNKVRTKMLENLISAPCWVNLGQFFEVSVLNVRHCPLLVLRNCSKLSSNAI